MTSCFISVAKKTAWEEWKAFAEVTKTFSDPGNMPLSLSDETVKHLQRFVILLYDRTSQSKKVDHCRKLLFANGRQIDRTPPTKAVLKEHVKSAMTDPRYE